MESPGGVYVSLSQESISLGWVYMANLYTRIYVHTHTRVQSFLIVDCEKEHVIIGNHVLAASNFSKERGAKASLFA